MKHHAVIKKDTMDIGKCSEYIEEKGQLKKATVFNIQITYIMWATYELHLVYC